MSTTLFHASRSIKLPSHYPPRVNALISTLLIYANEAEGYRLWASVETLSHQSGYSIRQTHRLLKMLVADGALQKTTQKCKGVKSRPIVYRINVGKLQEWGLNLATGLGMTLMSEERKKAFTLNEATENQNLKTLLAGVRSQNPHLDLKHSWLRFKQYHTNPRTLTQWDTAINAWFGRERKTAPKHKGAVRSTEGLRHALLQQGIDLNTTREYRTEQSWWGWLDARRSSTHISSK